MSEQYQVNLKEMQIPNRWETLWWKFFSEYNSNWWKCFTDLYSLTEIATGNNLEKGDEKMELNDLVVKQDCME